jgi:hypothetical protein
MTDEREKIAAWLRAEANALDARACDYIDSDAVILRREAATKRRIANRIKRGEHLEDEFIAIPRLEDGIVT